MKYVTAKNPEMVITEDTASTMCSGYATLETEADAIKAATKESRKANESIGIYKLIKIVEPPSPVIKDVD